MSLREQLRGTGVALITPFKKDQSVDFDALKNLIDHIIENGVQYIVSLGTTGEPPVLSKKEKLAAIIFLSYRGKFIRIDMPGIPLRYIQIFFIVDTYIVRVVKNFDGLVHFLRRLICIGR